MYISGEPQCRHRQGGAIKGFAEEAFLNKDQRALGIRRGLVAKNMFDLETWKKEKMWKMQ